jgi:hypothetical protein
MLASAPGKTLRRKALWHFSARGGFLLQRHFEPSGRALACCPICARAHQTTRPHLPICPTLARDLKLALKRTLERSHPVIITDPRSTKFTSELLAAHFRRWLDRDGAAKAMQATADGYMLEIRSAARAAGIERELNRVLTPPPPPPPEPRTPVRALRHYRLVRQGPHGPQEFSGASGSVMDVPLEVRRKLGAFVEDVGPDVPIRGVPLEGSMVVDTIVG